MNYVMTASGRFVEIQGTAEHKAFTKEQMDLMTEHASSAIKQLHVIQQQALNE